MQPERSGRLAREPRHEFSRARPEQRNAQSQQMLDELMAALDDAQRDDAVRVVVLGGQGAHFSAGHDLKQAQAERASFTVEERWAYEELGWGGYWFWDPVENASLLPWLTATAFLHSIQIQENRGMLKVWNMSLVLLTFLLTIFATFLTRSGLIESVHSFAQELKIAFIFLAFMSAITAASIVLILYRLPQLRTENQIESFLSRESAFLFNNLILLGATFAVLWGTLLPLLSEWLTGEKIGVGPALSDSATSGGSFIKSKPCPARTRCRASCDCGSNSCCSALAIARNA